MSVNEWMPVAYIKSETTCCARRSSVYTVIPHDDVVCNGVIRTDYHTNLSFKEAYRCDNKITFVKSRTEYARTYKITTLLSKCFRSVQ